MDQDWGGGITDQTWLNLGIGKLGTISGHLPNSPLPAMLLALLFTPRYKSVKNFKWAFSIEVLLFRLVKSLGIRDLKGEWQRTFLLAISILLDNQTMKILSLPSRTF